MSDVLEVAINGAAIGSIYAVVALGFVLVYKTSNVLNFAHGAIGAAGALMLASLVTDGGLGIGRLEGLNPLTSSAGSVWGWVVNLALAMALAALLGMTIERLAVRPMSGRSQFSVTMATIGVSISLQMFVDRAPIARILRVPWGAQTWEIGGAVVPKSAFAAIAIGVVSFAALAAFNHTRAGLAARAVASDQEAALVQGIDTGRVFSLTWAMAAAFATLAAVAFSFSPRGTGAVNTAATPALFFRALPVIAIGGWDSYLGAYVGGLAVGVIQVATGRLLSDQIDILGAGYPTIIPYVLMVVVLWVRPTGIWGQATIRRV